MTALDRFGSHLRSEWMLDPTVTYLNHGTVGAPPRQRDGRRGLARPCLGDIERLAAAVDALG